MDNNKYDALIIGGGVAGQEASLNLAKMGFKVMLVEKDLSIGGKMIHLSKVFPTLDCAACITTPKMSESGRHPNINLLTYSQVKDVKKNGKGFNAKIVKYPRYVDQNVCTGCSECEANCPVFTGDQYHYDFVARKRAYIPFTTSTPKVAAIDRDGHSSPCITTCPGGVKAYGFVTLVRDGLHDEAFNLHLEDNPLPGSLGRACYAPCEDECSRKLHDGNVDIRRIKRFFADNYYSKHADPITKEVEKTGKKIAVIGSGPAGLTSAYHLSLYGHDVTIFEAEKEAGGMLKTGIPSYRLPKNIVDRDIKNVTALGVEIKTNTRINNIKDLEKDGFNSIFISVGATKPNKLNVEGEDHQNVKGGLDFLKEVNLGNKTDLSNKDIAVVGGGNVAIDVARTALRLNAKSVHLICLEERNEMFAAEEEIKEAEEEGIIFHNSLGTTKINQNNGELTGIDTVECTSIFDSNGKFAPSFNNNKKGNVPADMVFVAIGQKPETDSFNEDGITINGNGTIEVNNETLQSGTSNIFAGGDGVTGASTIIEACGQGKRAAFFIDKYLQGEDLNKFKFDHRLPPVSKEEVIKRHENLKTTNPIYAHEREALERIKDFDETEATFTEEEAISSASRCLDCSVCRECHQCVASCPAGAIDFTQQEEEFEISADSVIVSTGFKLYPIEDLPQYGSGGFKNVISAMVMEKQLVPTRPFNTILRPSDGRVPDNIAYVLCAGSRDETAGNPICSQVCCMYSIKQAQLLMGALPIADITIYYMNIRSFGKGFEEFYQRAKGMGVQFIKGKVAKVDEIEDGNLSLRYEDILEGKVKEAQHDMVVLSTGILPNMDVSNIFNETPVELDKFNFVKQVDELVSPAETNINGVFVAGTASGPKDIPDTILSAGGAASEAASYLRRLK